ncbi:hypothetical protein GF362_04745 [Candidatus Dojkabacteria bacterium]|nr:hypothetical protein [Candidatus Dojkabacteria bacterium]
MERTNHNCVGELNCRALCNGRCTDTLPPRPDIDNLPPLCPVETWIQGNIPFAEGTPPQRMVNLLELIELLERVGRVDGIPNVLPLFGGKRVIYPKG